MNNCAFNQEEAKNQSAIKQIDKPLQISAMNKTKLHIRSQRKVDQKTALGSKGFEEEKASKTDDDLVLPEKQTKILHLSERNTVDLTKQKVSLLKNLKVSSKKSDDQPMSTENDTSRHKKRAFGEIITDSNQQDQTHTQQLSK